MKKFFPMMIAAVAVVVMFASCGHENTYPTSLVGVWQSQTINSTCYYLDVPTEMEATLCAYTDGVLSGPEEILSLTYDANTGKGMLCGNGRSLAITALNDTAFSIKMSAGEFVFTPATARPAVPTAGAAEGYWYSDLEQNGLIVCSKDAAGDIPALLTYRDIDPYEGLTTEYATVGSLLYTNEEKTEGTITVEDGEFSQVVNFAVSGDKMACSSADGLKMVLARQAPENAVPASPKGVWTMSYSFMEMVIMTLSAIVEDDGSCVVTYEMQEPGAQPETDTMQGQVYYSPVAGVGGITITDDYYTSAIRHKRAVESGVEAMVFKATSATTIELAMESEMGVKLVFNKEK